MIIIHSKCFWLAKITHINHHNQLLLTNFRRILPYRTDDVKKAAKLQIIKHLNEKIWGRVWVVFKESNGGTFYSFHGELMSSNIAGIARRQLDGQHLLLRVYLQTGKTLYILNFPIKMHYRYELNIDVGKHVLASF